MIQDEKKDSLGSECLPVKKAPAPPKVTPLLSTLLAVRSQVIYNSFRGGVGGGLMLLGLEALPARALGCSSSSDGGPSPSPLTGPRSPESNAVTRVLQHLVPFEANRSIMRPLELSSPCPCSIKAPSVQMRCPLVVPPACLHVYCQFYLTCANFPMRFLRAPLKCISSIEELWMTGKQCILKILSGCDMFVLLGGTEGINQISVT